MRESWMACINCGERDPEKLGIVVKVVKGYAEEKELCRPCWWREVEVRLTGENGNLLSEREAGKNADRSQSKTSPGIREFSG